jgi:hypothetical protein
LVSRSCLLMHKCRCAIRKAFLAVSWLANSWDFIVFEPGKSEKWIAKTHV